MTCSVYVKRGMLGMRFTDKVLPIVAAWVSGSVVTWMIVDNDRRNKKLAVNKTSPCHTIPLQA